MSGDLEAGTREDGATPCVSAPQSSVHGRHFCNLDNHTDPTFWELAMAGALRKTMVYLGLSEEDQRHDRYDDYAPTTSPTATTTRPSTPLP